MKEKRYMRIIKSLLLAAGSFAFLSCSNLFGDSSPESSSSENASSDKAQTITITGTISISEELKESGALPAEYLFLFNQINDSNERSAFPSTSSTNYYATATAEGKDAVNGTITTTATGASFTMAIPIDDTSTDWTIEAGLKDTFNTSTVTILKDTFSKSFSNTDPSFSHDFIIRPLTEGSGNIDLTISSTTSTANTPDTLELYLNGTRVTAGTGETISTSKITLKDKAKGVYKAKLVFKKNGYVVFTDYQGITVFPNMTTNTWVNSKSSITVPINGSTYTLTDTLVQDYRFTQIYVGSVTIGTTTISGNDTSGNGTIFAPFATFAKAITFLKENGNSFKDYTIWISGEITGAQTISDGTTESPTPILAKSLTISGYSGNTTDKLIGGDSGSVLYLDTSKPVKITNLTITGGKGTTVDSKLYGGGIYINKGSVELTTGVVVDGNTADVGGGVYLADGTLYLNDTAVVGKPLSALGANPTCAGTTSGTYANKATEKGGGIAINAGTLWLGYRPPVQGESQAQAKDTSGGVIYNLVTSTGATQGGGIDNYNGIINIARGVVSYNYASGTGTGSDDVGSGGGISTTKTLALQGNAEISHNESAYGGAVYIGNGGSFTMSAGTITENASKKQHTKWGDGGGIAIGGGGNFYMSGGTVSSNTAEGKGGAVYHTGTTFEISGSTAEIPKGTNETNNIQLETTSQKIKITGSTNSGDGEIAITPARWNRGDQIFADGSTTSYFSKFTLTDPEWGIVSYTVGNNTTGRIDAPLYVFAGTSEQTISGVTYGAGDTSTNGALGTKAKPYNTIADAVSQCWNGPNDNAENTGRVINIVGTITGNQSISADYATTAKASAISLQGVTGSTPKLDGNNSGTVLSIAATDKAYKIIISNLTITRGNASGESDDAKNGGGINISKGSLCLGNDVSITANKAAEQGGGVYIGNQARLFMYGTSIIGDLTASQAGGESTCANSAKYGGGVYSSGQLYIGYSGLDETNKPTGIALSGDYGIRRNYASKAGGGVYHKFQNGFYVSSGNISYNYCAELGGAVALYGYMTVNGGTFQSNKAGTNGGAVCMDNGEDSNVQLSIYGGYFYSNAAVNNGGAVYNNNAHFTMYGGQIGANSKLNTATSPGEGGAIYANGKSFDLYQDAYVYAGTRRSNDVYLAAGKMINPVNTDGEALTKTNVASITPSSTAVGTAILNGTYTEDNFTKFTVLGTTNYLISNGTLYGSPSVRTISNTTTSGTFAACSQSDLLDIASKVSAGTTDCSGITIKLAGDVTLNSSYTGIGTSNKPFKGTFDGDHKTVTFSNATNGIFGYVQGATISAVKTTGTIKSSNASNCLGAIAGTIKTSGTISLCANYANVTYEGTQSGYCSTGGVVGSVDNSSGSNSAVIIDQCKNWGTIKCDISSYGTGGIVGQGYGVTVQNCENFGEVINNGSKSLNGYTYYGFAGGIVGEAYVNGGKTNIYNCANNGNVTCSGQAGGILGGRGRSTIKNSWANCTVTSGNNKAGGISGETGHTLDNCYVRTATTIYPESTSVTGCTIITSSVATIMDSLNTQAATDNSWKEWYTNDGRLTIKSDDETWNGWMSTQ